jgi:hypothetical protein
MARCFKIIKKPRSSPLADIPISFPKLENLHLELLEIKDKLKKGLPPVPKSKPQINFKKEAKATESGTAKKIIPEQKSDKKSSELKEKSRKEEKREIEESKKDKSSKHDKEDKSSKHEKKDKSSKHEKDKSSKKDKHDKKEKSSKDKKKKSKHKDSSSDEESIVQELGEDEEKDETEEVSSSEEEIVNSSEDEDEEEDAVIDTAEVDIYAGLTPEERLEMEKEEYIWKFRLLKKQFGKTATIPIPEYNEHSDLNIMKKTYERTIKELYLDDAVETYRTYLLGGWIVMEYVCTQFLEIDLEGFTLQQIKMMYKYDRMLIELGEKSYTRWGMNLPVEIRLIGMILFQAGIFYLGKILADKFGHSVAELFKGMTGQPPTPEPLKRDRDTPSAATNGSGMGKAEKPPTKSRMRGPRINANDIRQQAANKEPEEEDED